MMKYDESQQIRTLCVHTSLPTHNTRVGHGHTTSALHLPLASAYEPSRNFSGSTDALGIPFYLDSAGDIYFTVLQAMNPADPDGVAGNFTRSVTGRMTMTRGPHSWSEFRQAFEALYATASTVGPYNYDATLRPEWKPDSSTVVGRNAENSGGNTRVTFAFPVPTHLKATGGFASFLGYPMSTPDSLVARKTRVPYPGGSEGDDPDLLRLYYDGVTAKSDITFEQLQMILLKSSPAFWTLPYQSLAFEAMNSSASHITYRSSGESHNQIVMLDRRIDHLCIWFTDEDGDPIYPVGQWTMTFLVEVVHRVDPMETLVWLMRSLLDNAKLQLVQTDILAHERMIHAEDQARKVLDTVLMPTFVGPSASIYAEDVWTGETETPMNTSFLGREPNKRPRSESNIE
jgi:hypothetical protein